MSVLVHLVEKKNQDIDFLEEWLEKQRLEEEIMQEDDIPTTLEPEEEIQQSEAVVQSLLCNTVSCKKLTHFSLEEFGGLLEECDVHLQATTFRGTQRTRQGTASKHSATLMLFITLSWLAHYPTLSFISVFFHLHERTVTQILKRTLAALHVTLKDEIRWPTDAEFQRYQQDFPSRMTTLLM